MRLRVCLLFSLLCVALHAKNTTSANEARPQAPGQTTSTPPGGAAGEPAVNGATSGSVPTIRTTSRLVILDTVVLDGKGNLVNDLRKEDFHVTEDDEPQTLLNFTPPGAFKPSADATINSTADLDRVAPRAPVNIILLDEFNTRFEDMAFARYSLKKFLDKQPAKLDQPTMLIAVSLQKFDVLQDYTQDKGAILNALEHHFVAYPWQIHNFAWISERYGQAFTTLLRVAQATEGHPGHKNMIWIGRGFPTLDFMRVAFDQQQRVETIVQQVVNKLRDARVTLYTVDPAGVQIDPGTYGQYSADFDPFGGNYEFNKLAKATGGRSFYGRNDVDAEIGTSIRDGGSFYTLVYRPAGGSNDPNKFRRIRVTFDNPGYHAVTRAGYYPQRGPARFHPDDIHGTVYRELVTANNSNITYDGVPVSLRADPADPDKFTIHVDSRGLNWTLATETEPRRAEVVVIASMFDKKGKIVGDPMARDITVQAKGQVPPTGRLERSIDFNLTLKHNPKAVRARFVVRVASTGRIGTVEADLHPGQQATSTPVVPPAPGQAAPPASSQP